MGSTWGRLVFCVSLGILSMFLLVTAGFATTEFYLLPNGLEKKIDCDQVEVSNKQLLCTGNSLNITYDLDKINTLEVVYAGKSYFVQNFTAEDIKRINDINANKINSKKIAQQERQEQENSIIYKATGGKKLSFASFSEFTQSVKALLKQFSANGLPSLIVVGIGAVILFIGDIAFLIAAFRVGIIWGLACLFLPFVSFFFLVLHWSVASKSFFTGLVGFAIMIAGATLFSGQERMRHVENNQFVSPVQQQRSTPKKQTSTRFTCEGKVYCSDMRSCAEATFYLQNCPGTKMDGDNDGIPCERQWCK